MTYIKTIIVTSLLCLLTSCASSKNSKEKVDPTFVNSEKESASTKEITLYRNKSVEKWISYFSEKDRERFERFLQNGDYYKEVIETTLEEEGLPYTLYYLPLIESGFNTKAISRARAVGPWQFIRGTAKRYGLDVNSYVDERRDPILSTEAATKYLRDLFNVFQSWELAIAAYNCGEMRVLRAIMKGKTRNFWELADKKLLPRETREYVPKFLAAAYLGENRDKYNFKIVGNDTYPDVESVEVPGGVTLKRVAKIIGEEYETLVHLNQSLRKKKTPTWLKDYEIWIQPESVNKVTAAYSKLSTYRDKRQTKRVSSSYKVRRGDNLSNIARKFRLSIDRLKRINGIHGSRIYIGQKLWLRSKKYRRVAGGSFYFVKRNDTLGKIARKYSVGVNYLRKLNGLHGNQIYIGQKIDVSQGVTTFKYRVKQGDNLNKIARLFSTSVHSIKKKNSLRSSRIYQGQFLNI